MMSITDPTTSDRFAKAMEEIHSKQLQAFGKITDMTTELCQSHKQFVNSALDTCTKKCKDDEMVFETIQTFRKYLEQKNKSLKEKCHAISDIISEIQQMEMQKDETVHKTEKLKEQEAKTRELIESQNKANKNRLKNLQKCRVMFQEHLGLELRTVLGKTELVRGENLQFVFRNIDPTDLESAYIVTMGINAEGSYQIVSSDPAIKCLPDLEKRLQETNNLAAFLANIRKEFISMARG